jgi:serine/threonine protein kinase
VIFVVAVNTMEIYHDDYEPVANINRYEHLSTLGEGTFGEVKKAYDSYTDKIVAIKSIRLLSKKKGLPKAVFREIESLRQLSDCIYIVKLDNVYAMENSVCLVMEYIENDLQKLIHYCSTRNKQLPRDQLKSLYQMMLHSIDFCHSHHVIHRDIKPSSKLPSWFC